MNTPFLTYYAILSIIISVLTMILANSRLGGWCLRLLAIILITMSTMILTSSYKQANSVTDYINEGRAALKERL